MSEFTCVSRREAGTQNPADCNWPHCDCDDHALRVLDALYEEGYVAPSDAEKMRVALQEIRKLCAGMAWLKPIVDLCDQGLSS